MESEKEEWRDVIGYEGYYQVSYNGAVKALERTVRHWRGGKKLVKERILKSGIGNNGYLRVNLHKKGKCKTISVHQLVAIGFHGHIPNGYDVVVDHINNIKTDNRAKNLQLISARKNTSKDRKSGTSKYIGVSWDKTPEKWRAQIEINSKNRYIGYFTSELEASSAYKTILAMIGNKSEECIDNYIEDNYATKYSSKYKGVSWDKFNNKWKAKITVNGKQNDIGRFASELDASMAYQKEKELLTKKQTK